MALSPEDQEQLESLRQWWKENGTSAIVGVLLGASTIGGYQGWRFWQDYRADAAGEVYHRYRVQLEAERTDEALAVAQELREDYPSTVYATMAGLTASRIHLDQGTSEQAQQWLDWVRKNAPEPSLQALATIRLARVYLEQEQWQEGLDLLENWSEEGWDASRHELLGDLYRQAGRLDNAREAYREARLAGADHEYLRFKLDSLGVSDLNS